MGIKVQYVGARSYTEFRLGNKVVGFGHGEIQEMDDAAEPLVRSLVENGSTMWKIIDDAPSKTKAMKEAIEPTVVEEIVEEPVVEAEAEAEESSDVDYDSMKRAELMALCKEQGIATKNTYTKAKLIELLTA
jgi:acyl carrier protein